MDSPRDLKPFPVSRFVDYTVFRFYYGYGNTAAEDFLEHLVGIKAPSILLLGCGDLRSCFYTLWKHFTVSGAYKSKFNGVKFDLVDYSAAVLARNILFLYLCLQKPTEKEAIKNWVAAIWAIWFCHELSEDHMSILNNSLVKLVKWSSNIQVWSESRENPLRTIAKYETEECLHKVASMWKHWLVKDGPSVDAMKDARKNLQKKGLKNEKFGEFTFFVELSHLNVVFPDEKRKKMEEEYNSYIKTGSVFAESVLGQSLPSKPTSVNPTMYETLDWDYTLHYGSLPYKCFPAPFLHTPSKKDMRKNGVPKAILDKIVVSDSSFESSPLLASCLQYFSLWLISSSKILASACSKQNPQIAFNFVFSDAVKFCQARNTRCMEPVFDLIHASNLIDHVSLTNLVLLTIPLLKIPGYLLTGTLLYKELSPSTFLYLEKCFGFKPHLLPLLCGMRCISHEDKYSSPVSISCKPQCMEVIDVGLKMLVWQRVIATPLKMTSLQEDSAVLNALYSSVCTTVLCFNQQPSFRLAPLCTGTAIMIIKTFFDQIDGSLKPLPFSFWEPLCSLLKCDRRLKPYMVSLQAQALLHSLHLHLILSESDCPLCRGEPVTSFLSQFTVSLDLPTSDLRHSTPCIMVYIHKNLVSNAIQCAFQGDMAVHIIDSTEGTIASNNELNLSFVAPSTLADEGLYMSVRSFTFAITQDKTTFFTLDKILESGKLIDFSTPTVTFSSNVYSSKSELPIGSSTLGVIDQHIGTGDEFGTVVSLSNSALVALDKRRITTTSISNSEIKFACGKCCLRICYPYPVDENTAKIVRQTSNKIDLKVARRSHVFHDETPYVTVDPANLITLVPFHSTHKIAMIYSPLQFSKKERQYTLDIRAGTQSHSAMPVLFNLKSTLSIMFQFPDVKLFALKHTDTKRYVAMAIVQSHVFDMHKKTPAVDLHYLFMDDIPVGYPLLREPLPLTTNSRDIFVDDKELKLLKKTFAYFSKCTNPSSIASNELLNNFTPDVHFTRAVVYPLYSDIPEDTMTSLQVDRPLFETDTKAPKPHARLESGGKCTCGYCDSTLSKVLKCSRCHKACYCNTTCQRSHWKEHQKVCKTATKPEATSEPDLLTQCGSCGKTASLSSLKQCPCHLVAYCNKQCQANGWPQHKQLCSRK